MASWSAEAPKGNGGEGVSRITLAWWQTSYVHQSKVFTMQSPSKGFKRSEGAIISSGCMAGRVVNDAAIA